MEHDWFRSAALSADGSQVALWYTDCLESSLTTCDLTEGTLYLVDVASGKTSTVGTSLDTFGWTMAFSPNGRHLAYCLPPTTLGDPGDLVLTEVP